MSRYYQSINHFKQPKFKRFGEWIMQKNDKSILNNKNNRCILSIVSTFSIKNKYFFCEHVQTSITVHVVVKKLSVIPWSERRQAQFMSNLYALNVSHFYTFTTLHYRLVKFISIWGFVMFVLNVYFYAMCTSIVTIFSYWRLFHVS